MKIRFAILIFAGWVSLPGVVAADYRELDWLELLTEADRLAITNLPPIDHGEGDDDSATVPSLGAGRNDLTTEQESIDVWFSVNVVDELNEELISLPGFVVPLEYDDSRRVTEFFLVPYFGACIHMPPPPPNQIVFVTVDGGFELSSIYEPHVIDGVMSTEMTERDIGISAYSVAADVVRPYRRR